jgi:hypothetical protein
MYVRTGLSISCSVPDHAYRNASLHSVTKSAAALAIVLAYNHAYSILDPAPLVLLGGCILVSVKLWSLQIRAVDPFLSPQGLAWQVLACLSVTPPDIDKFTAGGTRATGNGTKPPAEEKGKGEQKSLPKQEAQKEAATHLKHD